MDAAFRALSPNDRLMLLVDLILGPRGTDERVVAVMRGLLA
jgi:endonuclease III